MQKNGRQAYVHKVWLFTQQHPGRAAVLVNKQAGRLSSRHLELDVKQKSAVGADGGAAVTAVFAKGSVHVRDTTL